MKLSIIGAGNMGGAMARSFSKTDVFDEICVSDVNVEALKRLRDYSPKINVAWNNRDVVAGADYLVIAVKPWLVAEVVAEIKDALDYEATTVISIAATVSFDELKKLLDKDDSLPTLFRLIPNTAIEVGESVSSICTCNAGEEAVRQVMDIFGMVGKAFFVKEDQIAAYMALSSCGIAYAFRYIRAAVEGAVELGIYPDAAKQVVMQTLKGCVALLEANGSHPESEIDKVTTPGGTTIKGLNAMEQNGFTNAVIQGLKASCVKK